MLTFLANYTRNLAAVILGRQPRHPLLFSFYVTHRCELACSYCCDGGGRPFREDAVAELATPEAKKLLSILRGSADTLDITGGEPLIRDDLEEILAHAKRLGFRTMLNTKGIGLENRPDVFRHTDVLALSVDSLDTRVLSSIIGRSEETAMRVLDGLSFAMKTCEEAGVRLVLSTVAIPGKLAEASRVLRFAMAHSIGFHFSPDCVGTRANRALYNNRQFKELVDEATRFKQRGGPILGISPYLKGIKDFLPFRCHPLLMPTIRPNGVLYYPCLETRQADVSLLEYSSYTKALHAARELHGDPTQCGTQCHIFCHMALSLLQRHPIAALGELRHL
jgi:MoaA/NifB/PqqE/SkfB family radical SAM enzyme